MKLTYRETRRLTWIVFVVVLVVACGPAVDQNDPPPAHPERLFELQRVIEVAGRQGVATDGVHYYLSGSTELYKYSKLGELLSANEEALVGLDKPANHIGDIDVFQGELYAGIEWFEDGQGRDIQIAVYDAETLQYRRSFDWDPESGQVEVSAVVVDPDNGLVWMTDWVNGRYVYRYDLETGRYRGKLHLRPVPQWQQGIAYSGGHLYITADDGDADLDEADNLWRVPAMADGTAAFVEHALEFSDFRRAGEIEGVTFDPATGELLVLSNRGARIVLGTPSGFYPGYDREIHEVYVFAPVR